MTAARFIRHYRSGQHRRVRACAVGAILTMALFAMLPACSDPPAVPLPTLRSPASLVAASWCPVPQDGTVHYAAPEACLRGPDADPDRIVARVAVANRGNRYLHIVDMNRRRPGFLNLDDSVPGLTGVLVPPGPALLTALASPALGLLATEDEPGLHVVDFARPGLVGTLPAELPEPLSALGSVPGSDRVAWILAAEQVLVVSDVQVECDDAHGPDWHAGCAPNLDLVEVARLPLDGRGRHLSVDRQGIARITVEDSPRILQFAIGDRAVDTLCPGDAPCALTPLVADLPEGCLTGTAHDTGNGSTQPSATTPGSGVSNSGASASAPPASDEAPSGSPATDDPGSEPGDGSVPAESEDEPASDPSQSAQSQPTESAEFSDSGEESPAPEGSGADSTVDEGSGLDVPFQRDRCAEVLGDATRRRVQLGPMAVTAEGDLLVVIDRFNTELLVFDLDAGQLLDVNADNPLRRRSLGIPFTNGMLTHVLVDSIEATTPAPNGGTVRVVSRLAWVSSSVGVTWIAELDRTATLARDGQAIASGRDVLFRHRNAAARLANVRGLTCRVPDDLERRIERRGLDRCDNPLVPRPSVLVPDRRRGEGLPYPLDDGQAYIVLPQWSRADYDAAEDTILTQPFSDAWATPSDTWELVWEGTLPAAAGRRIRVTGPDARTVAFPGAGLCETGEDPCSSGVDLSGCSAARALCRAGHDPCEERFQLCDQCPDFCSANQDLCRAGAQPGDRLVLTPLTAPDDEPLPPQCAPWLEQAQLGPNAPLLEFEVSAVTPTGVEVAPLGDERAIEGFPPEACLVRPLLASIRTGDSWMFRGTRIYGHTSSFEARDGVCAPRVDSPDFDGRPRFGEPFTSWHGLRFQIDPGDEPPPRGFAILFRVDSNFSGTALGSNASVVASAVVRPPGRRPVVVLADDGRNVLRFHDHRSLSALPPTPLP